MRAAGVCLALALALALQTTLARFVAGGGTAVDLVLVVVVYVALSSGPVTGLWAGTVGGIAQDALSGGIIGIGGLAKTVVGFLSGVIGSQFIVVRPAPRFVVFCLATLVHAVCFLGLYVALPDSRGFVSPYGTVLSQALGNALVGILAFQIVEGVPVVLQRRRSERAHVSKRRLGEWGKG